MGIQSFFNSIDGKTIAFCGIGRSNLPVMQLFASKGAKIVARDKNQNLGDALEILKQIDAKLILGENYLEDLNEDMVLRTPGIPFTLPQFQDAIARGVNVTSEMEIFFELCPCKTYAVTGSDGKTTTTTMISEILKEDGKTVHLGGNIGRPLLPIIEKINALDVAVIELSSFQLMSMRKGPDVAVITNISPNHLDVHKDMDEYIQAKQNIYLYQDDRSKTVLNMDNPQTYACKTGVKDELWTFSRTQKTLSGVYCENGTIFVCGKEILNVSDMKLSGNHNVENLMAAICAVYEDVSETSIVKVAKNFGGVAHRAELVREFNDVKYYNDSIASSPARVMKGTLSMYNQKIILIVGGADKGVPFDELGDAICARTKSVIIVKPLKQIEGFKHSAGDKIQYAVTNSKYYDKENLKIFRVTNMEEAVKTASEIAEKGDIVSLSPACTSFDMYKDFEVRGNLFKEIVNNLE